MALFIYGTVFNNASRVKACISSLAPLGYKSMFIVDNYSTDGTYEILKNTENLSVVRKKCSHGLGRQIALENALKEAAEEDFLMYVDFDTVYNSEYIALIKKYAETLKENEVFIFGMLSKAKANRSVHWRNLFTSEDLERYAHFKSLGYKLVMDREKFDIVYGGKGLINKYYQNDNSVGENFYDRHKRYKTSSFSFGIRMFRVLVDNERGAAFKSFREFYSSASIKSMVRLFLFMIAYAIAHILGVYKYSKNKNNIEYIGEDSSN
jgi:glycosyltransferase involved in cell wall biosynthesis